MPFAASPHHCHWALQQCERCDRSQRQRGARLDAGDLVFEPVHAGIHLVLSGDLVHATLAAQLVLEVLDRIDAVEPPTVPPQRWGWLFFLKKKSGAATNLNQFIQRCAFCVQACLKDKNKVYFCAAKRERRNSATTVVIHNQSNNDPQILTANDLQLHL